MEEGFVPSQQPHQPLQASVSGRAAFFEPAAVRLESGERGRQRSPVLVRDDPATSGTGTASDIYRPALWRISSRERQERDSLRSRSKEGRPGSRKHRRWTHSVDLVHSLRRVMVARGEENLPEDMDAVEEAKREHWPSAFYRLMQHEGPHGALEAWRDAENKRPRSRERAKNRPAKDGLTLAEERRRMVRRAFRDTWAYLSRDNGSQELIAKIEVVVETAFGKALVGIEDECELLVNWNGDELTTEFGTPPAAEMVVIGLDAAQRKVVHQLANILGLHSESRVLEEDASIFRTAAERKVLALRPPRSLNIGAGRGAWIAPFSVSQVLSAAVKTALA
eukprot:TRINITY_DN19920_c0_g1_i1.p1 TRINITY_DN19920_c0_g1~~TRINITY_DN19920_c0_g1_i1.p1  ORF type:complete len:336 (-),score=72.29 TRINITY_DN19920_c0_g1_i1:49-1056(-)